MKAHEGRWRRKSICSSTVDCVEVSWRITPSPLLEGEDPTSIRVMRDTKDPGKTCLFLAGHHFRDMVTRIKRGELDLERLPRHDLEMGAYRSS